MDFETQVAHQETAERQEPRSAAEIQYELERNKPMPSLNHARIQMRLVAHLFNAYAHAYDVLPELSIDFPVKPAVPDVCIYPITPADWQNDVIKRVDIPLLAIEILSPRQIFDDIIDKIQKIYFPAGMSSVWVVLPSVQSVMIFTPNAKPQMYTSGIMHDAASGFEIDLDKIFWFIAYRTPKTATFYVKVAVFCCYTEGAKILVSQMLKFGKKVMEGIQAWTYFLSLQS